MEYGQIRAEVDSALCLNIMVAYNHEFIKTGIYQFERHINSSTFTDFQFCGKLIVNHPFISNDIRTWECIEVEYGSLEIIKDPSEPDLIYDNDFKGKEYEIKYDLMLKNNKRIVGHYKGSPKTGYVHF